MQESRGRVGIGLGAAALLMGASGLISRLLGYGRDVLLAYFAGVGPETDAYFAAFVLPDLLNYLLAGGALSIAFLPFYNRALQRDGEEAASALLATVLGNLGLIVIVATAILWWRADWLIAVQFPEFDESTRKLTVEVTRIVLPAQIFFVLGGVLKATLFARGSFRAAALAPLIYNLAIIVGGLIGYEASGVRGFAWGVLVGAVLGPFLAPLVDAVRSGRVRVRVHLSDRLFIAYLLVAAPLMFGQSLLTFDEWFDKWFGALLGEGSVAYLSYARKLMLVPVGVVGQAIATAALPTLTRLWEAGDRDALDAVVLRSTQAGLGLGIVAAGGLALLAPQLVELVYQRGAWTPEDTTVVSRLLRILALAVPLWIGQQILVRPFYARGDTLRPMVLGSIIVLLSIPMYAELSDRFGVFGLAWAGVFGMGITLAATYSMARVLHGSPSFTGLLDTWIRSISVTLVAGAAVAGLASLDSQWSVLPDGPARSLAELILGAGVYGTLILLGLNLFGDLGTRTALGRVLRRIGVSKDS